MGSAFLTASRGAGALGSAIGLGGGLSGAGAGLLAAIGGIPGIIAAAVSALAVLGIQIFKTKSSVLNFGLSVQKQIEELQPGLKKPSAGNADNIESYWQQMGFVDGVFVGLGDYHGAVKKTANLDATKDFTELQQSFNDITNLGQNEAIQKIEELRNAGKMLYRDHGMYTFNNKSGETFYSQLYNKRLTTLRPKDVNEENFKDLIAYSDGYNNQLKALQPINDLFLDLASKVVYGAPIGEFEAKNFINSATGLDIDSLNGLGDKRINERVQGSYAQLMKSGFDRKTIDLIYKALPETITKLIPPSQLYSNKDVRIDGGSEGLTVATENDENGNFVTPSPVSSISVPKYSKQQPKQINISIDSLAKDIKVNLEIGRAHV